jgi:hypothetical protein
MSIMNSASDKSRERMAWFLVALVGMFLGYFIWRTYLIPIPQNYVLDFSNSEALIAAPSAPTAFFRKTLNLPCKVRHAWLAVAGSESFVLYVNGTAVGKELFKQTTEPVARNIYDLTANLGPGKNVLALQVYRNTFPEPAWVQVIGGYTTWEGKTHAITSDLTWRANIREENILRTGKPLLWSEVLYDDVLWPRARSYAGDKDYYPARVESWPFVYATAPQGSWIWDSRGMDRETRLTRSLSCPFPGPQKIWIRLSGLCPYRLTLNGDTVAMRTKASQNFDIFDLKPLMRWGDNQLGLAIQRSPGKVGMMVEIFVQQPSGEIEVLRGDDGWAISTGGGGGIHPAPAVLAPYPSYPGATLSQMPNEISFPWWYWWWYGATFLLMAGGTGLIVVGLWWLWVYLWSRTSETQHLRWRLAFFHLPAGLFLGFIFLLGYDIRFPPDFPFQPWIIVTALALLVSGGVIGGWSQSLERNQ